MSEEDKKLKKHLVDEMMKVYETNPDVMFYMEALMKKYEELEQENINIKQQLLENKISLKDVEYQEKIKLQQKVEQLENIRKEAIKYINHATIGADSSPIEDSWLYNLYETRNILNKGDNNGRK